jgi:hypothetical protein
MFYIPKNVFETVNLIHKYYLFNSTKKLNLEYLSWWILITNNSIIEGKGMTIIFNKKI